MEYQWWIGAQPLLDRAHIARWEVIEVLYSATRWPRPAKTPNGLSVLTVWGRTDENRPLVVLLRRPRPYATSWQIMLAAPMRPDQLAEYTAWEAQR
ncbi:hypothetical protein [Nocardia stercoris]|uniref:Uncharacterized protein n=1 Tax=Nocardia stercoris TaxID=2483361 RepID=A0A3M2L7L3_9NOCA|nr:hypothetical protein [Nocardia stercoris]RMI33344.1 hypothetical protein EBN03_09260 [Nocardia stercoris]